MTTNTKLNDKTINRTANRTSIGKDNGKMSGALLFALGILFTVLAIGSGTLYSAMIHHDIKVSDYITLPQKNSLSGGTAPTLQTGTDIAQKAPASTSLAEKPSSDTSPETAESTAASGSQLGEVTRTVPIVAVRTSDELGMMGNLTVRLIPGNGDVLVKTTPFIEPDVQYSANTAVTIAEQLARVKLTDNDIVVVYESNATMVGGGSAGGATTVAIMAMLENKTIRPDVAMTGTINEDGTIGQIGGVFEKMRAVGEAGYKIFLVPKGQSTASYYEKTLEKQEIAPGYFIYRYKYTPKTIDIAKEAQDQYGLKVIEVSDVLEAANYMMVSQAS